MYTLPVFTKGAKALVHLDELITALENGGCTIEDLEIIQITHSQCANHYKKLVGGPYYEEIQTLLDSCPSAVLKVSSKSIDEVLKIIGENTDPQKCSKESLRYKYGESKGANAYHRPENLEEITIDYQNFWGPSGFVQNFRNSTIIRDVCYKKVLLIIPNALQIMGLLDKYRRSGSLIKNWNNGL